MSNENRDSNFKALNFETKPTGAPMQVVDIDLDPELMVKDFATAYERELFRRNANRAEREKLTAAELYTYFQGLIAIHLEHDNVGTVKDWRKAKELYIPAWIQHVLSQVGTYVDPIRGLKFVPHIKCQYDMKVMLEISDRLGAFRVDGLKIFKDAFPRNPEGDAEVMSMIIAEDCVRSMSPDAHPSSSYVAAFLGFKLREEMALLMMYRVKYDDIVYVHEMLLREESIRQ